MRFKEWLKSGTPWIWINAGGVAVCIIMVVGLLGLIAARGLVHFWPSDVLQTQLIQDQKSQIIAGEIVDVEQVAFAQIQAAGVNVDDGKEFYTRYLLKVGNRDVTGNDFVWVLKRDLKAEIYPKEIMTIERREWGNFYGYLMSVQENGQVVVDDKSILWAEFQLRIERAMDIYQQIYAIEKHDIGRINHKMERLRLKQRTLELKGPISSDVKADLLAARTQLDAEYALLEKQLMELYALFTRDSIVAKTASGQTVTINISKVVRANQPNAMGVVDKLISYSAKLWEFVSDDPREANTEGGVFPAIYGTVLMVLLMSVFVAPFGVITAVYLREYAHQGIVTRTIRIAVNNLAGVPSIVYGIFGLGFFVYFLGGEIDQLFFPEALPAPTFGTSGLLWASLTLALLTVPIVIVATEEGLSRIPLSLREGSLALGATKFETLWRVVLPMSSPAIMTGLILAIARAAGEVAPLMLVGVVKLAPSLPLDQNYPYLHLDQKFMHLGFHIYDVGFQSPNVEAARPLVYATALLLVVVIATLNFSAVAMRNHLREKYKALEV